MSRIFLDSDVIIEHLRGNQVVLETLEALMTKGTLVFYSPISRAEIGQGLRPGEESAAQEFFDQLICVDINDEIGQKAGQYLKTWRKSHNVELGDALIAACASASKAPLFTFNRKHYPMKEIKFFSQTKKLTGK